MESTRTHFIGAKDCPYTIKNQNLVEFRRARLRGIAKKLDVSAEGSKNDLLKRVIGKLKMMDAPKELSEE